MTATLTRADVRAFVEVRRGELELAQAENRLPQFRLDLRDAFEQATDPLDEGDRAKCVRMFDEEVDAFCQQLRIGGMVVTNQVEREIAKPKSRGLAMMLAGMFGTLMALVISVAAHLPYEVSATLVIVFTVGAMILVKRL